MTHSKSGLVRWACWMICGLLIGLAIAWSATSVEAQEETLDETAVAAPTASASSSGEAAETRTLLDTLKDGGVVGVVIILLSMVATGFVVEHFLTIRKAALMPEPVIEELDQLLATGQIDEAINACQLPENQCLISEIVLAGLQRFKASEFGFAEYKAACEEAGEDQTGRLYRKTEVLGLIGGIAPMLGLLGTVLGMISAFNTIAMKGGMARPDELAGGIGEALVTTLLGLMVAIPSMVAFSFFRNKIDSIIAEAGKRVEQIMLPLGRRK